MSFQGEIRSGKGLLVEEPHMSQNSSKAGQVKQTANHPVKSVGLELSCISLASLLPFWWMAKCPQSKEQQGRGGREIPVLDKLLHRKRLLAP